MFTPGASLKPFHIPPLQTDTISPELNRYLLFSALLSDLLRGEHL